MESPGQDAPPFLRVMAHPLRWRLLTELAGSDYRVRELTERVAQPQNLVSYHLRLLRGSGLVTARRSSFDARDSYHHLDLERCAEALTATGLSLHPALGLRLAPGPHPEPTDGTAFRTSREAAAAQTVPGRPKVLFACTGNSARSPIAEALLRGRGVAEVESAGSHPRPHLRPEAVAVLREEFGLDVAGRSPRHLRTLTGRRFDYVITLCDRVREVCPPFDGEPRRIHWSLPEPEDRATFSRVAAQIDTRIQHLLPVLGEGGRRDRS